VNFASRQKKALAFFPVEQDWKKLWKGFEDPSPS
jgi:hypothetical protein